MQEWVSSKETTKGRLVQKLHVPRAIIRAARTTGIAFNGYSGKQDRASELEATREDSGRLRFDSLPGHLARFREHDSIPLSASKSKLIWNAFSVIQTLNRPRAVDSRLRGNDEIQGAHPQPRPSREGGNPLPLSEPQETPSNSMLLAAPAVPWDALQ